jgi:hypothetical protein
MAFKPYPISSVEPRQQAAEVGADLAFEGVVCHAV